MDLFAQPPFRADAEAVADDQHTDQQLRIDRRSSRLTVKGARCARTPSSQQSDQSHAADVSPAHAVPAKTRRTTLLVGLAAPPSSTAPSRRDLRKSSNYIALAQSFFNKIA